MPMWWLRALNHTISSPPPWSSGRLLSSMLWSGRSNLSHNIISVKSPRSDASPRFPTVCSISWCCYATKPASEERIRTKRKTRSIFYILAPFPSPLALLSTECQQIHLQILILIHLRYWSLDIDWCRLIRILKTTQMQDFCQISRLE